MFSKTWTKRFTADYSESIGRLKEALKKAEAVVIGAGAGLSISVGSGTKMNIPSELIPKCPVCDAPMTMNLRCDDTFVQDEGGMRRRSATVTLLVSITG